MPDRINELRISLVGVRLHPKLVEAKLPDTPRWAALASPDVYAEVAAAARQRIGRFEVPWPQTNDTRPDAQHFWHRYLGAKAPDSVEPAALWNNLVPLRRSTGATMTSADLKVRTEAFHYPHATAVVVTVVITGGFAPLDAAAAAFNARRQARYTITADGHAQVDVTLDTVLDSLLRHAHELRGNAAATPGPVLDPYTIVTVVRGVSDASVSVPSGGDVHRALDCMAAWNAAWGTNQLGPLEASVHRNNRAPASHLLYLAPRGRVMWYPTWFTSTAPRIHKLGCAHRNIVLLTMQTQALLGVVALADEPYAQPSVLRSLLLENAVGLLGRLYGPGPGMPPVSDMYQSWSARRQIDDSGLAGSIDRYRTLSDMRPLARTPAAPAAVP